MTMFTVLSSLFPLSLSPTGLAFESIFSMHQLSGYTIIIFIHHSSRDDV